MIGKASFHRGRDPQRLVDSAEIVICMVDRNHVAVILKLLGECIREASKASNAHPHRKILAFNYDDMI